MIENLILNEINLNKNKQTPLDKFLNHNNVFIKEKGYILCKCCDYKCNLLCINPKRK